MHEKHGRQRTFIDLTGHIDLAIQLGTLYEDVQCVDIGNSLRGIGTVVRIPKQIVSILIHKEIPFYTCTQARTASAAHLCLLPNCTGPCTDVVIGLR